MDARMISEIYNKLQDEESRNIFDARMKYAITGNEFDFFECLYKNKKILYDDWDIHLLQDSYYQNKKFIIYGTGNYGMHTYYILENSLLKGRIIGFSDSDSSKWNTEINGLPVIPPYGLHEYSDAIVIVSSSKYAASIYLKLAHEDFPQYNIFLPQYKRLTGGCGFQYFDLFKPGEHEIFVDAGCFDGDTSVKFTKWCNGNYDKIYAFEPQKVMTEIIGNVFTTHKVRDYEIINKATWSNDEELYFNETGDDSSGAAISNRGKLRIEATSIDNVLQGKPATFIKMDVEGSELQSLYGAANTIKKYRPKLAISLYHKPQDIFELPQCILELNPDYKLYIRHYTSDIWETVLYAE